MSTFLEALQDKTRPLVFGHRGAMAYAPMNTIPAFEKALEQGADGLELDVWLSQDDVPMVIHDFELSHTTNGEDTVGSTPYEMLKSLDAGSWFDEAYAGETIPTLDEVFEAVGQRTLINVEIKSKSLETANIVHHTVECIRRHNMRDRVLVSSFNPFVLRQMRKAASDIPLGHLQAPDVAKWMRWVLLGVPLAAWHPYQKTVTAEAVAQAKRRGQFVNTWTVNEADDARRLAAMGVDCLITDNPDVILAALAEPDVE